jgi:TonB-dependent siderophore receptor
MALAISSLNAHSAWVWAGEQASESPRSERQDPRKAQRIEEEIVVVGVRGVRPNANKMPLSIRETPQTVSIITRDSLDARQVVTLGQALEMSAGVTQYSGNGPFAGQPSFGFNQTTIRGIQIDDIYDFRQDGFVNGSYYSIPDLAIYERIEVVKGPNSMLYGRGSAGGLINRVRKQPLEQRRAEVSLDVGSYDTYRVDVDVTGPLLTESMRGRLVAAYEDSESFVRGPQTERTVIAPSLSFDLTPRTRLLLQGFYQSDDIIANTGLPLIATDSGFEAPDISRRQYNGVVTDDPYTWKTESASLQLEQEIDDRWLATLRLDSTNIDTPIRTDAYAYSYGGVGEDGNVNVMANDFHLDRDVWSGELQLTGQLDFGGREARVSVGADWNENEYSRRGAYAYAYTPGNLYDGTFPVPDPATLTPGFATHSQPTNRGAYAQARIKATERLAILLGVRYDNVELDVLPYHAILGDVPDRVKDTVDEVTGRIGLTYDLNDVVTVYTLYSQSFEPELFSTGADGELLQPQTGELYELGVKSEWFGGRLGVNAAVYRIDRENIATDVPDDPSDDIPPYAVASGLQRSDGVELEINGEPMPGWDVSVALNYVDSAYEDRNDPLYGFQPGGTPDWQVGLYSAYQVQSGPLQGFGFGATLFAIDERGVGFTPGTIPGYERVDLHAFYRGLDSTEVSLVIRNILDERYIEGTDRPGAYAQFGSPTAAMLTVRREF